MMERPAGLLIWYSAGRQAEDVRDRLMDLTGNGYDLMLYGVTVNGGGYVEFTRWRVYGCCLRPFRLGRFTIICRRGGFQDANGCAPSNAVVAKGRSEFVPGGVNPLHRDSYGGIRLESGDGSARCCYVGGRGTAVAGAFAADGISVLTNERYYMYGAEDEAVALAGGGERDSRSYPLFVNPRRGDSSQFTLGFRLYDLLIFDRILSEEEVKEAVEMMINV